jgi:hypothetical protein
MVVLNTLRSVPGALRRNPSIFLPVLVISLLQFPQLLLQSINPILSSLVSLFASGLLLLVLPFLQGGLIGMAAEALDGRTSLSTFTSTGKTYYIRLLIASLAVFVVNFVFGMAVFIGALFGGVLFLSSDGQPNLLVVALLGAIALISLAVYLGFVFFIQFYSQAIVLEDLGIVDGFKRSIQLVRAHLISTLGYSLLVGTLGGLVGVVVGVSSLVFSPQQPALTLVDIPEIPLVGLVGVALILLVGSTLLGGFFATYSVSFYRALSQ